MKENQTANEPRELASRLAVEHGLDNAIDLATEAILQCQDEGNFYSLSIWREVRRHLRTRKQKTN